MKTIYKYLPDDFPLEKHLQSPELKLSLVNTLNDPYEGQMTKNAIDKFSELLLKNSDIFERYIKENGRERAKYVATESIIEVLKKTCITSFSETQRNLLMWSHYSSHHKGICIGYDVDVLDDPYTDASLQKVNYDCVLYDQEHLDELDQVTDIFSDEINSFCYRLFTTKSDDWMYEKEHRYISSCGTASRIIVNCSFDNLSPAEKMAISTAEANKTHKITKYNDHLEIHNLRSPEEQLKSNKRWIELEQIILENNKAVLFRNISTNKIKHIYLGVFFDKTKEDELLKLIKSKKELNHISVYRYTISQERYELVPCKIHPTPLL